MARRTCSSRAAAVGGQEGRRGTNEAWAMSILLLGVPPARPLRPRPWRHPGTMAPRTLTTSPTGADIGSGTRVPPVTDSGHRTCRWTGCAAHSSRCSCSSRAWDSMSSRRRSPERSVVPPCGRCRHRHDQLAVEAPEGAGVGCGESEVRCSVQSPRVPLGLEGDGAVPADWSTRISWIQTRCRHRSGGARSDRCSLRLVPEPQHSVVTVLAMFEHFGPAQVGKSEVEVESGVGQECRDGLFRSTEAVLRVKAHRQIPVTVGRLSRSRSLGARRATAYQPTKWVTSSGTRETSRARRRRLRHRPDPSGPGPAEAGPLDSARARPVAPVALIRGLPRVVRDDRHPLDRASRNDERGALHRPAVLGADAGLPAVHLHHPVADRTCRRLRRPGCPRGAGGGGPGMRRRC